MRLAPVPQDAAAAEKLAAAVWQAHTTGCRLVHSLAAAQAAAGPGVAVPLWGVEMWVGLLEGLNKGRARVELLQS